MKDNLPDEKEYKKYNYKLTPFKLCVLQNFPFIEADFDAITNYQLLCKVVEYLNHVIDNQNTVEDNFKIMADNLNTLYNFLDTLDLQDEVNNKLDEMVEDGTLANIINQHLFSNINYDDKQEVILYSFFDDDNDDLINFYVSDDGVNLKQIKTRDKIYGRDPSILYKNGKYYVAVTNYAEDHDFIIYESEDLNNWVTHNISVGLYNSEYPKVWCPEWFIDDNDDIYIFLANQYANTEGWGDFELYKTECTSLENLTFSNVTKLILNGATSNNHIDPAVIKYNNLYHMFCKNEHQTELYLEHYTSPDLITWTLIETDPGNFGRDVEAPFIYKLNNEIVIGSERYRAKPYYKSFYMVKKTNDFINYSNRADLIHPDIDISHGGGTVIEVKTLNKILNSEYNKLEVISNNYLYDENIFNKNYYLVANRTTVNDQNEGEQLGRYLKLFTINTKSNWKFEGVIFHLTDVVLGEINGLYSLLCKRSNNQITQIYFNEINSTSPSKPDVTYISKSAKGSLYAIRNENEPNKVDVYLDLQQAKLNTLNHAFALSIISFNGWNGEIITYKEKFENTITSNLKLSCGASNENRTMYIDNKNNTQIRIKFCAYNGIATIKGQQNSLSNTKLIDGIIILNNGTISYINKNSELTSDITVTLENYDNSTGLKEYTILISNLTKSSSLIFQLPYANLNFITSIEYLQ